MKAIQDIVDYLFGQNLLAREDLRRLDVLGLLSGTEAEDFARDQAPAAPMDEAPCDQASEPERWLDLAEAEIERQALRRRRASGPKPTTPLVTGAVLSDRILDCLADSEGDLAGLRRFAAILGPAETRVSAQRTLAAASDAALDQAIATLLGRSAGHRGRTADFLDLWHAATFRGYGSLLNKGEHGPAAVAYQALAAGAYFSELGRYQVALVAPGLAELMQLVRVQRRILRRIGVLLKASPALFDRPLFLRTRDGGCYWALTLAITALQSAIPASAAIVLEPASFYLGARACQCRAFADALVVTGLTVETLAPWQDDWSTLRCPPAWNLSIAYFHKDDGKSMTGAP